MKAIIQTQCPNCWGYQTYEYQAEEQEVCENNQL